MGTGKYLSFKLEHSTALKFSYVGASAAFMLALLTIPIFPTGNPFGWYALPDTLLLLFGGWGMLKGNRLISILLPAYALASRYVVSKTLGQAGQDTLANCIIFLAYALGIIGAFARDRRARMQSAAKDTRWIDDGIAISFTRIAGAAGLGFGILVGMFALSEVGGFTWYNLIDAFLILLFAWSTLKRRHWAATSQLVLNMGNMAVSYVQTRSFGAVLDFIPVFLFELYALGFIGTAVLSSTNQPAGLNSNIETSGRAGPKPLTSCRPSPDLVTQVKREN